MKGSNQQNKPLGMAILGSRKISQAEAANQSMDGGGLAIAGSQKDYTQRPEPKPVLDYSSPQAVVGKKRASKGVLNANVPPVAPNNLGGAIIDTDEGTSFNQRVRDSASASAPQTVDTVFMSHERSPKFMAAGTHPY